MSKLGESAGIKHTFKSKLNIYNWQTLKSKGIVYYYISTCLAMLGMLHWCIPCALRTCFNMFCKMFQRL